MKLVIFKIGNGDSDYEALEFEKSGKTIEEIYNQMIQEGSTIVTDSIYDEDDDSFYDAWCVIKHTEIEVKDEHQAQEIVQLISDMADDDWLGDYDSRKSIDWAHLLIED